MSDPIRFTPKENMGLPFFTLMIGAIVVISIVLIVKRTRSDGNFPTLWIVISVLLIGGLIGFMYHIRSRAGAITIYHDRIETKSFTLPLDEIQVLREDSVQVSVYIQGRPTPQVQQRLIADTSEGAKVIADSGAYDLEAVRTAIEAVLKSR